MDAFNDGIAPQEPEMLSYDDNVAYEEQLPTEAELAAQASLANRISASKVYLLSESSAATRGKHRTNGIEDDMVEEDEMDEDVTYRANALLLKGSPISNLTTTRMLAYATHFEAHPLGLEWVDDNTCILVFTYKKQARDAFAKLQKLPSEEPDMEEFYTARPFPIALWPPEARLNESLGQSEGLRGSIRMRWAKAEDVKKSGARKESDFYKKHGSAAGKELFNGRDLPPPVRRKRDRNDYDDEALQKAQLDDDLDRFLAEDDDVDQGTEDAQDEADDPSSPPSKMRSDYIAPDGRTLLQRTSNIRLHGDVSPPPLDLASRLTRPLPRRERQKRGGSRAFDSPFISVNDRLESPVHEKLEWGPSESERPHKRQRNVRDWEVDGAFINGESTNGPAYKNGGGRRSRRGDRPNRPSARPKKTQQELDDELDAFLRS